MEVSTDWHSTLQYLGQISLFTILIPIFTAFCHRKYWNKPLKIAFLYCMATLGVNLIEQGFIWAVYTYADFFLPILNDWAITDTRFLQIFIYLKNFLLIGAFYTLIFPIKKIKKWIKRVVAVFTLIALIYYLFIEGYQRLGTISPLVHNLFILGFLGFLPVYYFWISQMESIRIPLRKSPYLWISTGLMIPNFIGLLLFGIGEHLYAHDFIIFCQFFSVKILCEIIGHLLIAIGFSYAYYVRFISLKLYPLSRFRQKASSEVAAPSYLRTHKMITSEKLPKTSQHW